jgi:ABC-type sulfate transport system substrate-binding protein
MSLFELGAGDALVTYEQDALLALDRGVPLEIVIPPRTIVAEPVAVIVDDHLTRAERPVAEAFLRYLLGQEGQAAFARYHQRPVAGDSAGFAPVPAPFTVNDLGGWSQAHRHVVETVWAKEIEPHLNLEDLSQLLHPDPVCYRFVTQPLAFPAMLIFPGSGECSG